MTISSTQFKGRKTLLFTTENQKIAGTPKYIALYLETLLKDYDFGYYVKAAQSKFKKNLIESASREVEITLNSFTLGLITINEKDNRIVDIWLHAGCCLHRFIISECYRDSGPYNYNNKTHKKERKAYVRRGFVLTEQLKLRYN